MRVKCVENSRFSDQNIDGQFITLSAETAIGGPPRSVREFNIQVASLSSSIVVSVVLDTVTIRVHSSRESGPNRESLSDNSPKRLN